MRRQAHGRGIKLHVSLYLNHGDLLHTLDFLLFTAAATLVAAVTDTAALAAAVPYFIYCRPRPSPFLIVSAAAARAATILACAIMSTLDEISNAFAAAVDIFKPVVGAATDDNVERIRRAVAELLHIFHYHGKHNSLSGLINPEVKYTSRFGHAFDRVEDIDADDYDPEILSDPNNQDTRKREGIFKAQNIRAILVAMTNAEARRFILAVVEETWVIELEDPDTYNNEVTVRHFLGHLSDNGGGLNDTDAVDIRLAIPT